MTDSSCRIANRGKPAAARPRPTARQSPLCRLETASGFLVIPARLASTRLPRKLLLAETGKPLIQHTYEAAGGPRGPRAFAWRPITKKSPRRFARFGGQVRMTSPDCASGTDRVAEIARQMPEVEIFVNVQGDEPELSGEAIDRVIELLARDPGAVMATLATPIRSRRQLDDPACVKVVFDARGPGALFQPQPDPARPAVGRQLARRPSRRRFISTSGCMPIAATFCCAWPTFRARRWRGWKTWSSFACWSRAIRSPWA